MKSKVKALSQTAVVFCVLLLGGVVLTAFAGQGPTKIAEKTFTTNIVIKPAPVKEWNKINQIGD